MKQSVEHSALLSRFRRSGLSVSRFCFQEGICQAGFRRLLKGSNAEFHVGFFQPICFLDSQQGLIPVVAPR
jgi:hypothetical protein